MRELKNVQNNTKRSSRIRRTISVQSPEIKEVDKRIIVSEKKEESSKI